MCGIAGVLTRGGRPGDLQAAAVGMADACRHRGPDSSGAWTDPAGLVALAHRRLAILDLTPTGHQPMESPDGHLVVSLNGEIYNYKELREQLSRAGHVFRGTSDTEVLLAACAEWGVEGALTRFVGMFAFALWDRRSRVLTLARDRMGEKPLYYGWVSGSFLFGSELKALRAHPDWRGEIDRDVLGLYFRHGFVPGPYSIYRGVWKLPPGSLLSLSSEQAGLPQSAKPHTYWSLREVVQRGQETRFIGTDTEAIDELESLLRTAVAGQMVADVPVGAFLSGGVDSSLVVALMQSVARHPVRTFTIGFDVPSFDESPYARAVARHLGTDHEEVRVTAQEALEVIPSLPALYDEPFADSSQIPTFLVSRVARRQVTVSLSGDGGDELFAGYNRYVKLQTLWAWLQKLPRAARHVLARGLSAAPAALWDRAVLRGMGHASERIQKLAGVVAAANIADAYTQLTSVWSAACLPVRGAAPLETLFSRPSEWPTGGNEIERLLYLDTAIGLPDDMLVKVDRAAMAVSLETRVPLLDHRVVEFAFRLPLSMRLRRGEGKWILRRALDRHVPRSLVDRPKTGFSIPLATWLRGPLRSWADGLLDKARIEREGWLDPGPIRSRWAEHLSGARSWSSSLWAVLMFEAWLEAEPRTPVRASAHATRRAS